ncbi:type II secretion system protein GspC [Marinospirillum insulare]|uniref:Type II secretion system protein GspC N-terminal domain-containing protein n=1 Tax=Marinospirillum insulare TaxID=217169 RepID=A0ABQ5ZVM9_9GAMM|nr:type II secretion system protein GspC [Marinospirillum insulare]GLR63088.1 hypothetical protein GCM10007878_05230 [Marinospirillum insulare]
MALANLLWSILVWRYPLPPETTSAEKTAHQVTAAWLEGLDQHWLKKEQETPSFVPEKTAEPIQISRLAVKVQGVLFSNLAERSVVLLNYRNKDLTLSVGDRLEEGIVLVAIQQEALVFNRNGVLEQVLLAFDEPSQLSNKQANTNKQATNSKQQLPTEFRKEFREEFTEQKVGTRVLEETFGPEFRKDLVKDPLQLMSYVSVSPSSKKGELQGFVLQPGSKPELFKHFGLQAGDLLIKVDGAAVSDTSAMLALHSRLATAESLDVELLRDNERVNIRLEME